MRNPIYGASAERAARLTAAGVPLDYEVEAPFKIEPIDYYPNSVYVRGLFHAIWVIPIRLVAGRAMVITTITLEQTWNHSITWGEPEEVLPKDLMSDYERFLGARMMRVLTGGRLLKRGFPLEGILCGYSTQPVGEIGSEIIAQLRLTDDRGNTLSANLGLEVHNNSHSWTRFAVKAHSRIFPLGFASTPIEFLPIVVPQGNGET